MNPLNIETDAPDSEAAREREVKKLTWAGLILNLVLSGLKLFGGIVGNSQAVVADAVHSLSDITTDLAILLGIRYWSKPADDMHPHGHRKLETLVTLVIGFILAIVAVGLVWNAVESLKKPAGPAPGWVALAAAAVSIVSKELLYRWTLATGLRVRSMPLVANAWHHRSDAFSSIPVVLTVAGAAIKPTWVFLDQVGAFFVSVFILHVAYKIVKPTFAKLLDSGAPAEDLEKINEIAGKTEGVKDVHRLRTRYLGCYHIAMDLHIEVDAELTVREGHEISEEVKKRLIAEIPHVFDVVVHLEPHPD